MSRDPGNYSFKMSLNTTAGYFELPNYKNGQLPGPLLSDDPELHCDEQCTRQHFPFYNSKLALRDEPDDNTEATLANMARSVSTNMSRGPLLSTTLALFGIGSYFDIRRTVAGAYHDDSTNEWNWGGCIDTVPFVKLLQGPDGDSVSHDLDPCVEGTHTDLEQPTLVAAYIWLFAPDERDDHPSIERIQDSFVAVAFLAVDSWSRETAQTLSATATLNWDMGADLQAPDISHAGVTLISILLGIYLTCLLGLSLYTAWTPRWTNQLDSFAMMRISTAVMGRFPLRLSHNPDKIKDLDELPGWIGGVPSMEDDGVDGVSELALGGEMPLRARKRYHCYETDDMKNPTGNKKGRRFGHSAAPRRKK